MTNTDHSDAAKPVIHTVPELETLLPPLTATEKAGLEKDLLARGVLSALVTWNGILVDGHHRLEICKKHGVPFHTREISFQNIDEAKFWAWQHQESRRNLTAYQRAEIALKLKPQIAAKAKERQGQRNDLVSDNIPAMLPECKETRQELADMAKLGSRTIDKVEFLDKNADEKTKEKLRSGDTTIHAEFKRLRKEKSQKERELHKRADCLVPLDDRVRLLNCSIAEASERIEAESVDFIVTDPPYPKEFLSVYDELAEFAQASLKPGGSLLCMAGQSYLPEIVQKLSKTLRYHWILAYLTPGGQATQLWERKVNTFWKPVLWFTKGEYTGDWIGDVTNSKPNDNDKRHHHWGQSESGMFDLMQKFLYPNRTVCDPFLGGGTTGIVALSLGCRFIGCDIDQNCIEKSQERFTKWIGDQA